MKKILKVIALVMLAALMVGSIVVFYIELDKAESQKMNEGAALQQESGCTALVSGITGTRD